MKDPYIRIMVDGRRVVEHLVIVERVLGKKLPKAAKIHHVDGNGKNNEHSNLVVCPDQAYHFLLHTRTDALEACGNPDWLACRICKIWDDPKNMRVFKQPKGTGWIARHRACHASEELARYHRNKT